VGGWVGVSVCVCVQNVCTHILNIYIHTYIYVYIDIRKTYIYIYTYNYTHNMVHWAGVFPLPGVLALGGDFCCLQVLTNTVHTNTVVTN